ncbi:MAG: hypothetical protein IJT06_05335, partial [Selenomonadaceae bacterium]|nr:hypothetical protein [Selenomonadaceae bacterium]
MAEKKSLGTLQNLRKQIRDDISLSKNPYEILLDVAKTVGEISGEENFYQEIRELIVAIYGDVFQKKPVLEIELAEVSARREKIQAALSKEEFSDDDKRRIKSALIRHDKEIERLKKI